MTATLGAAMARLLLDSTGCSDRAGKNLGQKGAFVFDCVLIVSPHCRDPRRGDGAAAAGQDRMQRAAGAGRGCSFSGARHGDSSAGQR